MLATSVTGGTADHLQPPPLPPFLRIPRELRDLVYDYYFRADDNFTYDFAANKLKQANGLPIPLSLTLVSQQIHNEVRGLALKLNTLAFTTSFDEANQEHAALYHAALIAIQHRKTALVNDLAPELLSTDMAKVVAKLHPQFAPIIEIWQSQGWVQDFRQPNISWGEPPSIWRDFTNLVLSQIAKDTLFLERTHAKSRPFNDYDGDQALKLVGLCMQPWITPSVAELEEMQKITLLEPTMPCYLPITRYVYSAASSAIRFLRSISPTTRATIRNIQVLEDRESVAFPECHGRGFAPFCQENLELRVTHMVSLWKNAFPVSDHHKLVYLGGILPRTPEHIDRDRLSARDITKSVGAWLMEASALSSCDMPSYSYTLVLDGYPNIEHTSEVFRVVQRDIAWQSALDACYARGLLPASSWKDRRRRTRYMYEGLPDIVRTLSTNSTLVRTSFDPGVPFNVENLLEERQGWSLEEWEQDWGQYEPEEFQTRAPLPLWHTLRWQYCLLWSLAQALDDMAKSIPSRLGWPVLVCFMLHQL